MASPFKNNGSHNPETFFEGPTVFCFHRAWRRPEALSPLVHFEKSPKKEKHVTLSDFFRDCRGFPATRTQHAVQRDPPGPRGISRSSSARTSCENITTPYTEWYTNAQEAMSGRRPTLPEGDPAGVSGVDQISRIVQDFAPPYWHSIVRSLHGITPHEHVVPLQHGRDFLVSG
jgi:hypothetical protein